MNTTKLLLFGTGSMAYEYAKVLKAQGRKFIVVGRGQDSATEFQKKTGIVPLTGGAVKFLSTDNFSSYKAIVSVTGNQLGNVTLALIKHGIKSILVEKPGGLDEKEIQSIGDEAKKHSVEIFVAYNRRFYSSVKKAEEIIREDNGVLSFIFEFNEPAEIIAQSKTPDEIKKRWLLHNSTHVIDLAFFLGGTPKSIIANTTSPIFTGCGIAGADTPFTYHANWLAPGRWGLELMTKNHRLIFRPMEKLNIQKHGSFEILSINIDDKLDTNFKPGLFREVESFLKDKSNLCTIEEQLENVKWYSKIKG